jgi:multiple sugar transport system permease protein
MNYATAQRWNLFGGIATVLTVAFAVLWVFPIYWGIISSLKPEDEVVRPYVELWPQNLTFEHYIGTLTKTQIGIWYLNSLAVALGVTIITIVSSMLAGYALSQLSFPGRKILWWLILASFMVPTQTLPADGGLRLSQHLGWHDPAAAHPSRDHHRLQAVLR